MVGHTFRELERRDHDWLFTFSEGVCLVAACPWRLLAGDRIRVSADDDGQSFGFSKPVDAAAEVTDRIGGSMISSVTLRSGVLDLSIGFDDGHRLEVLPTSSGYEAWQVDRATDHSSVIALGSGELARYERPR